MSERQVVEVGEGGGGEKGHGGIVGEGGVGGGGEGPGADIGDNSHGVFRLH